MESNFNEKKWLALINPISGGKKAEKKWNKTIKKQLEDINLNFDEYITSAPNDAIQKIVSEIDNYDGFIAVGGDGISNEVINGILHGTIEKGNQNDKFFTIIPAGTGNDIAHAFGLPYKDIEASCNLFKPENAQKRSVDVGKAIGKNFNNDPVNRYFCGVLSSGFDAEVAYKSNNGKKWLPGTANYIKALLTNIIWLKSKEFDVSLKKSEEDLSFTKRGIFIAVGLGPYYGAGMKICPNAQIDDGLFHITFLNKVPRRTLLRVFPKVYDGKHITHKKVDLYEAQELGINTDKDTYWQVDGEIIGFTPVKIETLPKTLHILAPILNDSNDK